MSVEKEIIFIVGCPRSGTTFLGKVLRELFDIGFVNELQIIPVFYKKLNKYSPLDERNLDRLISDILRNSFFTVFKKTYSKYTGKPVEITKDDILKRLPERSYAGIIYSIMENAALKIGKTRIGSKNPDSYLDIIHELFPKAKIIHIIRDGRDCALSFYRMRWGHTNAYMAAKTWKFHVKKNRYLGPLLFSKNYIEIKYESLLQSPLEELTRIANFISAKADQNFMKDFIESVAFKNNFYKWKKRMSLKDLAIFQSVAGDILQECGYEILHELKPIKLTFFHKIFYYLSDRLKREYRYRFLKELPA